MLKLTVVYTDKLFATIPDKIVVDQLAQCLLRKIIDMTLRELQDQALELPVEERWQLVYILMRSLQSESQAKVQSAGLAQSLIGIAKTDMPPPTDEEVEAMLDERLTQKYL